jgi:glycosyltransferase involved in cell wall biosynthesis
MMQGMNPKTAVIIPVYNAVHALELVLTGYSRQSFRDFELFIADDGSGPEIRAIAEAFSQDSPFPIRYVCQPDEGFRKSRILNQAVRASSAQHLIFADQDCIPHREFVAAHWSHKLARTVLCGRRVTLSPRISRHLTPQNIRSGKLERLTPSKIFDALLGRGAHWEEGILIRSRFLLSWINHKEPMLLGSNFSLNRSLLEEVNGFNEDFIGYGGEDTELEYRLRLAGARFQWVRHQAIQYHLYHSLRSGTQTNLAILERTQTEARAACRNGLRKDLHVPTSD